MYLKWVAFMLLNLFGFVTAPIMFPIAYALRNVGIVRNKILWIYYDDEDEFGFDVSWWMVGRKKNFWTAYKWAALRNPAWNLHALFSDKEKKITITKLSGRLFHNGDWAPAALNTSAVLKYVDEEGNYMDNKGPIFSRKHSHIGQQYMEFYDEKGHNFWRYSYANKLIGKLWLELQIGFTTRPQFRLKVKKITKIV